MSEQNFKSGFVAIMGCPNAGKSTLLNNLVGTKVAITTSRPQTTRNVIHGVVTGKDHQIVFLDTPGLHTPKNRLGEYMMKRARESAKEVDAVLYLVDLKMGLLERDRENLRELSAGPLLVALNKADAVSAEKIEQIKAQVAEALQTEKIFVISAMNGQGVDKLFNELKTYLKEGPKYYPDDMITDRPERFIAAELIREKAMTYLREELPYGVGVEIEEISAREGSDVFDVAAVIYCEKQSHKGIIIGKNGEMLKRIGFFARTDLEMLLGARVFLKLWVKVKEDWRNSPSVLKTLGYD